MYKIWYFQEEEYGTNVSNEDRDEKDEEDEMVNVLQDIVGPSVVDIGVSNDDDIFMIPKHRRMDQGQKIDELFNEIETEFYPRCEKFSTLIFLVKFMYIKVLNR